MGKIFFIVVLFINVLLYSVTYTVKQDGTGDYSQIQSAIEEATDNDTILVYPGIYHETLDFMNKSITLGSLNLITDDDTIYIHNTIIDGENILDGIKIIDVENGKLQGFTIKNCIGTSTYTFRGGGGVYIKNSQMILKNNIIFNNKAHDGGGVCINNSQVDLIGNKIYYNHARQAGGGLLAAGDATILNFDENRLNSIYLNYGSEGSDIAINLPYVTNIILDKFTIMNPDPEKFYIC